MKMIHHFGDAPTYGTPEQVTYGPGVPIPPKQPYRPAPSPWQTDPAVKARRVAEVMAICGACEHLGERRFADDHAHCRRCVNCNGAHRVHLIEGLCPMGKFSALGSVPAPPPADQLSDREQANRLLCYDCDHRDRRNCIDHRPCVDRAAENTCPKGKFGAPPAKAAGPMPLYHPDGRTVQIQGLYRGRSAFLICGGPSFKKLDHNLLRQPGILTMGVNNSVRTFRPNIATHVDQSDHFIRSIYLDPLIMKFSPRGLLGQRLFDSDKWEWTDQRIQDSPNLLAYDRDLGPKGSATPVTNFLTSPAIWWGTDGEAGRSVMFAAVRILYELGIRRIFLLGVDFTMSADYGYHFDHKPSDSSVRGNNASYPVINRRFTDLRPYLERQGLQVFNCNPESKLKAFPFLKYENAIALARAEFGNIDVARERTSGLYTQEKPKAPEVAKPTLPALVNTAERVADIAITKIALPEDAPYNMAVLRLGPDRLIGAYRSGLNRRNPIAAIDLNGALGASRDSWRVLGLERNDDPRLVAHNGDVYMSTSCWENGFSTERIKLWRLSSDFQSVVPVAHFNKIEDDPLYELVHEKNWVPFSSDGRLYFIQWMQPHRILEVRGDKVHLVAENDWKWPAGWSTAFRYELRLSAPPVRMADGDFLGTFHTYTKGNGGYHTGFYVFEGRFPFRILKISAAPVMTPAHAPGRCPNKRPGCIFINGMVIDGTRVTVTGGQNDVACVAIPFELPTLLAQMSPVESVEPIHISEPPRIMVATATLSRADLLNANYAQMAANLRPGDRLLILDNGRQNIRLPAGPGVEIVTAEANVGVSAAWNFFLQRAFERDKFDGLIILGDDIKWDTYRIEAARRLLVERPDIHLFLSGSAFDIHMHRPETYQRVGLFDEAFSPAWCEDDDYAMRVMVAGLHYWRFRQMNPLSGSVHGGTALPYGVARARFAAKWPEDPRFGINYAQYGHYLSNIGLPDMSRRRVVPLPDTSMRKIIDGFNARHLPGLGASALA